MRLWSRSQGALWASEGSTGAGDSDANTCPHAGQAGAGCWQEASIPYLKDLSTV